MASSVPGCRASIFRHGVLLFFCMEQKILLGIIQEISRPIADTIKVTPNLGLLTGNIGMGGDETKYGDQIVEDELKKVIPMVMEKYGIKNFLVISEETGHWVEGNIEGEGVFMIIDPIDGSNNMRPHSTPRPFLGFSIAIGSLEKLFADGTFQSIEAGLVRDIFHNEEYWATKGGGAFLDGIKLNSSPVTNLKESVLGASLDKLGQRLSKIFRQGVYDLLLNTMFQRRIGSSAIDLCFLAAGDYDLYISLSGGIKVHDIAAVKLIIEEAGGAVELYKDGQVVNNDKWLLELYNRGNEGIKEIGFPMLASGNQILLDKAKNYLTFE